METLERELDSGGGITGAGIALDATTRGLRTALVERDDFASGTSSKSSKMIRLSGWPVARWGSNVLGSVPF